MTEKPGGQEGYPYGTITKDDHELILQALEEWKLAMLEEVGEMASAKLSRKSGAYMEEVEKPGQKVVVRIRELNKLIKRLQRLQPVRGTTG